eukprot:scaffold658_cov148-Skeletonema_menzelii.AAC.6
MNEKPSTDSSPSSTFSIIYLLTSQQSHPSLRLSNKKYRLLQGGYGYGYVAVAMAMAMAMAMGQT